MESRAGQAYPRWDAFFPAGGVPPFRLRERSPGLYRTERMTTIAAQGPPADAVAPHAPRATMLVAIALAGCAAAACTVALALTSDHVREPGIHAALQVWGLLGFVLAGVVAWWRRPESRFGPLMILAGGAWFLSVLASSNHAVPFTVGMAFDLVPAVVFLHVFLAFPTGLLKRWFERALVGAGYVTAFALQLVGMALGGFGSDNLLEVAA